VLTYTPGGNNTFANNLVRGNGAIGISVDDTDDNIVRNNTVVDSNIGINARLTTGTTVAANTVRGADFVGISVSQSERVLVDGNTVAESGVGLRVIDDTTALVAVDNTITANEHGVAARPAASDGAVVGYNDIVDNEGYGAVVYSGSYHRGNTSFSTVPAATSDITDLNATHNYWASADGPTATAPGGDASNTVSPNVAVQPVTDESTTVPGSLTRRGQTGGDETDSEDGSDDSSSDETDDDGEESDDAGESESSDSTEDTSEGDGETDSEDSAGGDGDTGTGSASDSGAGFGALTAVVALTTAALVARRRG